MPQPWTTSGERDASAATAASSRSSKARRSASPRRRATSIAGFPHGLVLPRHPVPVGAAPPRQRRWPEPLAATTTDPFSAAFVLRGHPRVGRADSHLVVFRHRYVGRGHARRHHGRATTASSPRSARSSSMVDADFADLFEVKEGRVEKSGELETRRRPATPPHVDATGAAPSAAARTSTSREPPRSRRAHAQLRGHRAAARRLVGRASQLTPVVDDAGDHARATSAGARSSGRRPSTRLEEWRRSLPPITTDHDGFSALLDRSTEDLAALRLFDPEHPDRTVVAAGRAVVHDAVRTRLPAHVVDGDDRRLRPRARHAADAGALPGRRREPDHRGGAGPHPARDALRRVGASSRSAAAASTTAASTPRRCS